MRAPLRLLVCAFGPFPGVAVNPSARFARALVRRRRPALAEVRCELMILPTRWTALETLSRHINERAPDGVFLIGVAPRRRFVDVETRAVNAAAWRADAGRGHHPCRRLRPEGAPARASTAPAMPLLRALRAAGVPARRSRDAGRYLCNASLYLTLEQLAGCKKGAPVIFIHLPGRTGVPAGTSPGRLLAGLSAALVAFAHAARTARRGA